MSSAFDRRAFVSAVGATAAYALLKPVAVRAETASTAFPAIKTKQRLLLSCQYPVSAAGTHDLARGIGAAIERLLAERHHIEVITRPEGSIDVLTQGHADIHVGPEGANICHNSALAFFGGLPGRFAPDASQTGRWLTGEGQSLWHAAHARNGLRPMFAGAEGNEPGLWSRSEIDGFSNLKIAAGGGLRAEVLKALGADAIALPPADWKDALSSGAVDAVEVAGLEDALALGIPHVATYCMTGATAHGPAPCAATFAPHVLASFDASARAAIAADCARHGYRIASQSSRNAPALQAAIASAYGCNFTRSGQEMAATINRLSEAVIAELASHDSLCEHLGRAVMAIDPNAEQIVG